MMEILYMFLYIVVGVFLSVAAYRFYREVR